MNPSIRTLLFNFSALLVLVGTALFFSKLFFAPYLFASGSAGIAICHLTTPTKGMDYRRRRLQIFNVIAGLLLVVGSSFMFMNRNEWILCVTIAALLMLYTSFVVPNEK
ncbi:MAG: hypothetical protein LBF62_12730 [Tannerellaceae bacterium]|jgi:hypothetical protein|nr:hypothetical protein [Tannerellaceae bacterium]